MGNYKWYCKKCNFSSSKSRHIENHKLHCNQTYTYKINNLDKKILKKQCDIIIPFGVRCSNAIGLKNIEWREYALPFDYIAVKNPIKILDCFKDNFKNFTKKGEIKNLNYYGIPMSHFPNFFDKEKEKLEKRIVRFMKILNSDKYVIFMYSNEDFFYKEDNRKNSDLFYNYLIEIKDYIKNRFPKLNFLIICCDGIYRQSTDKIINIHIELHKEYKLLDRAIEKNWKKSKLNKIYLQYQYDFRKMISKILIENFIKPTNNIE